MADSNAVDPSTLSEREREILASFMAVVEDQNQAAAIALLRRSQWNLEIAITRHYDGEPATDPVEEARAAMAADAAAAAEAEAATPPPPRPNNRPLPPQRNSRERLSPAPRIVPQTDTVTRRPPGILSIFLLPFSLVWKITQGFAYVFASLFPFLPRLLSRFYSTNRRRATTSSATINPRDTAARFIREFEEENGATGLRFFEGGYAQALDLAKKDLKFLLVVLQSDEHDDTVSFNKETLGSPDVVKFINDHDIILWGGSVQDSEAYQVSSALQCTKFPFAALISHTPPPLPSMSVISRIVGITPPSQFISKLTAAIASHSEPLERIRTTRAAQEADREIRAQQESAYERSLARDRERARLRREVEENARKAEAEAEAKRLAEENYQANLEAWRRWRSRSLPGETSQDGSGKSARVSIRFSNGERVVRRFAADASMEDVYAYVECINVNQEEGSEKVEDGPPEGFEHEYKFRLASPMPRRVFEPDTGKTVAACLYPSANLIVEAIEEDDEEDEEE